MGRLHGVLSGSTELCDDLAPCHRASSAKSRWTCPWTPENVESPNHTTTRRTTRQADNICIKGWIVVWVDSPRTGKALQSLLAKASFQNFACLLIYAQNSVKSIIPPWSMSIVLTQETGKKPCSTRDRPSRRGSCTPFLPLLETGEGRALPQVPGVPGSGSAALKISGLWASC